jgi:kinesin family protein 6/9
LVFLIDISLESGENRGLLTIDVHAEADPGLFHNCENGKLRYEFDQVFDEFVTNENIYDMVAKDKVLDALDGINCTIFAYGQTGSGKTYTILGGDSFHDRGIIPRAITNIFEEVKIRNAERNFMFKIHISFTEIYKETVYDLLDANKKSQPIEQWPEVQVLEGENGLVLRNVNVFEVESEEQALSVFFMGNTNRITSSTQMNNVSSRSHAIFSIIIESEGIINDRTVLTSGKINLVDLAGSERMYKMNNSKDQVVEAKSINLSLHYLEQVIISLRDQANIREKDNNYNKKHSLKSHIPYRNSILTSILRDSLGGNCRSCFILNIATERIHFEESVSTCRFGQRCGEIKVNVHANTEVGLSDQLKELTIKLNLVEKQLLNSENQRKEAIESIENEKKLRIEMCEARNITTDEKFTIKSCVQNLLNSAKESLDHPTEHGERLIAKSQEDFFEDVETMDKAVLLELSTALGGVLQSMYIKNEKEKKKRQEDKSDELSLKKSNQSNEETKSNSDNKSKNNLDLIENDFIKNDLSTSDIEMVRAGANFIKYGRLGIKQPRFVCLSPDLTHICWKHLGSNGNHNSAPLINFECIELDQSEKSKFTKDSCVLFLRGNPGIRSLYFEFNSYASLEQNRIRAVKWANTIAICREAAATGSHVSSLGVSN